MVSDHWWLALAIVGTGGLGIGIGLVIGAFVVRVLRRYMTTENNH